MSLEVQNRGISDPTKRTYVLQKFFFFKKIFNSTYHIILKDRTQSSVSFRVFLLEMTFDIESCDPNLQTISAKLIFTDLHQKG